ncbi:MAG: response regulator [Verrucomicrobiota bacterium]|nr:response regulator [Verrucomicrobiota bacterium]
MSQKQLRVIVVEDHADTAEGLRRFLTSIGYHVYIAPDVASARALAKAVEYDILLSDLRLPDGTGWELMQELSAEGRVPAIAMSGYNSDEDVRRSMQVGFLYHIAKPLAPETLSRALDQVAKQQRIPAN